MCFADKIIHQPAGLPAQKRILCCQCLWVRAILVKSPLLEGCKFSCTYQDATVLLVFHDRKDLPDAVKRKTARRNGGIGITLAGVVLKVCSSTIVKRVFACRHYVRLFVSGLYSFVSKSPRSLMPVFPIFPCQKVRLSVFRFPF